MPSTSRFGADFLFSASECFLWSSPNEIKGVSFRRGNGGSDWGRSPTPPRIALDRDGVIRGAGSRRATQEGRWLQTSYLQAARVSGGLTVAVLCVALVMHERRLFLYIITVQITERGTQSPSFPLKGETFKMLRFPFCLPRF